MVLNNRKTITEFYAHTAIELDNTPQDTIIC